MTSKVKIQQTIIGGQILSRVTADPKHNDKPIRLKFPTIVAKTINAGIVDDDNIVYNDYKKEIDEKRLTKEGDIVIKLTTPHCAALIDKEHEGLLVSSFCSIIRDVEGIDKNYYVAFLNSEVAERQFEALNPTTNVMRVITISAIEKLEIPAARESKMKQIGNYFINHSKKKILFDKIIKLEEEKLSSYYKELIGGDK